MDAIAEQLIDAALARLKLHDDASASKNAEDARGRSQPRETAVAVQHFAGAEAQMRFAVSILNGRIGALGFQMEMVPVAPALGCLGQLEVRLTRHSGGDCRLLISVDEGGIAECRMADQHDSRKMRAFNILDVDQGHFEQLLATFFSKAISEAGRML